MSPDGSSETPRRPRPRRQRSPWVATLVVLAVLAVLAVVFWVPVTATSSSSYCGSCKATQPASESWKGSIHADVDCVECHIAPGVGNQVAWRAREALNIWADYLNVPQTGEVGQRPGNENCTSCHDVSGVGDEHEVVRMPHQRHVGISDLVCADCHDTVSHGPRETAGDVSMSVCGMCHAKETAASQCAFCHLKPEHLENPHAGDYLETHGQEARPDVSVCLRCHHNPEAFCDDCHSRPTPDHFSGTWKYTHRSVAEKDREGCLGCHDEQTFCRQCHQVDHPGDWLRSHRAVAARGGGSCLTCHPQSMCDRCHERSR